MLETVGFLFIPGVWVSVHNVDSLPGGGHVPGDAHVDGEPALAGAGARAGAGGGGAST